MFKSSKSGERFVFYGTGADPVFKMESQVDLPILKDGEVLVKVRAATICLSDIHTVCGTRIEPTPRFDKKYCIFNYLLNFVNF